MCCISCVWNYSAMEVKDKIIKQLESIYGEDEQNEACARAIMTIGARYCEGCSMKDVCINAGCEWLLESG